MELLLWNALNKEEICGFFGGIDLEFFFETFLFRLRNPFINLFFGSFKMRNRAFDDEIPFLTSQKIFKNHLVV